MDQLLQQIRSREAELEAKKKKLKEHLKQREAQLNHREDQLKGIISPRADRTSSILTAEYSWKRDDVRFDRRLL